MRSPKKFFCFCRETLELLSRLYGATWPRYYTSYICTLQDERGQHITVRKLHLLTWGVLLARVLVNTDVSREESMISSYTFPATVHAAPTATERRSYHVIQKTDQTASWVICCRYPLIPVPVVSKFWPGTVSCLVSSYKNCFIFKFWKSSKLCFQKHAILKWSSQPTVTLWFVFNQIFGAELSFRMCDRA